MQPVWSEAARRARLYQCHSVAVVRGDLIALNWGIDTERQTLFAGVVDAFVEQYQLTTNVLLKALGASEAWVSAARQQTM